MKLFLATALAVLLPLSVNAQSNCHNKQTAISAIEGTGRTLAVAGVFSTEKSILELWTSPEGGWTAIVHHNNGVSCIVADGSNFELIPQGPKA